MNSPEIGALRGSSFARSSRVAKCSAEPGLQPGRELLRMQQWPLRSHVELPALPSSARSARLHTARVLRRWRLDGLIETAELLTSEIISNAVRATTAGAYQQRQTDQAPGAQLLRFWLTSDRNSVLIQVWDGDRHPPVRKDVGPDAEAGRGLMLIETLSAQWGWYDADGQRGKIVWPCAPSSSGGWRGTPATAVAAG